MSSNPHKNGCGSARIEVTRMLVASHKIPAYQNLYIVADPPSPPFSDKLWLWTDYIAVIDWNLHRIPVEEMALQLDISEEEYMEMFEEEQEDWTSQEEPTKEEEEDGLPGLSFEDFPDSKVLDLYASRFCLSHEGIFSCCFCGMETVNVHQFRTHLTLFHEVHFDSLSCWECKREFKCVKSLMHHVFFSHMVEGLRVHHGIDLNTMEHVFKFNQMSLLLQFDLYVASTQAQFLPCQPEFECLHCNRRFQNYNQLEEHTARKNKRLVSEI